VNQSEDLEEAFDTDTPSSSSSPSDGDSLKSSKNKIVKIVDASNIEVNSENISISDTRTYKLGLFDLEDNYIEPAEGFWSINDTSLTADISVSGSGTQITFNPSTVGSYFISAIYTGSRNDLLAQSDTTGELHILSTSDPSTIISIAGDNQTAVVNTNLANAIGIRIKDAGGNPVEGLSINVAATLGGGSVLSANPASTDVNGEATFIVKTGIFAGTNNNQFRATIVSTPSLYVDFTHSSIASAPSYLEITTAPAGFYAGTTFIDQPVITLKDVYGNALTTATGNIVATKKTGTGVLSGTTTIPLVSGSSTFTDLQYDTAEAGVSFTFTYGGLTVDSAAFTVNAPPPGACTNSDAFFKTADGGCKDQNTTLVWSQATTLIKWNEIIWDSTFAGSTSPDTNDKGRTNDLEQKNNHFFWDEMITTISAHKDNSNLSYCHDLNQGGHTDWVVPSCEELIALKVNINSGGAGTYINGPIAQYWCNRNIQIKSENWGTTLSLATGAETNRVYSDRTGGICVRNRTTLKLGSKLIITHTPKKVGVNATVTHLPLIVEIKDEDGKAVNQAGVNITISSTDLGALGGTLTASTDNFGRAHLNAFTLDTIGTANLTISTTGYPDISHPIEVTTQEFNCLVNDTAFNSLDGGCKDIAANKVWSKPYIDMDFRLQWHHIIWDSALAGNTAPDAFDNAKTNDYVDGTSTLVDNSYTDYCHDLIESGQQDWRVPTKPELLVLAGKDFQKYFYALNDESMPFLDMWTSDNHHSTHSDFVNMSTGATSWKYANRGALTFGICVRDP